MTKELYKNFNISSNFDYGSAKTVDYVGLPFEDNSMYNEFANNKNIVSVSNISSSVTNMYGAFKNCSNLTSIDKLPNKTENLSDTFWGCSNLVNAPVIPDSVTDISGTFTNCSKLTSVPVIPNSVTNMSYTFASCYNLVNTPVIPNSVTTMVGVFANCSSIVNAPVIPNSVTDMWQVFLGCSNLVNASEIPNSVTSMAYTFDGCTSLTGNIYIYSEQVDSANDCFNSTSLTKNVYIPFTSIKGDNSATYNSFINAGYDENGTSCGVYLKDINEGIVTYNPTCGTNTSTPFWSVFSDTYTIHNNEKIRFKFKTYSAAMNNWDCWGFILNNPDNNEEYLYMREDAYGWGTYYDPSSISYSWANWDVFRTTCLDNAITCMEVSLYNNKIYARNVIIANDGTEYTYNFATLELPSIDNGVNIKFSCENSYLVLPDDA